VSPILVCSPWPIVAGRRPSSFSAIVPSSWFRCSAATSPQIVRTASELRSNKRSPGTLSKPSLPSSGYVLKAQTCRPVCACESRVTLSYLLYPVSLVFDVFCIRCCVSLSQKRLLGALRGRVFGKEKECRTLSWTGRVCTAGPLECIKICAA
jgi:hypothetical protein